MATDSSNTPRSTGSMNGSTNGSTSRSTNRTGLFLGGLVIGAAIGTALGLLSAPRSGRETRRILKQSATGAVEGMSVTVQTQTARLLDRAEQSLDETLLKLQKAIVVGKEAMLLKRQELNVQRHRETLNGSGLIDDRLEELDHQEVTATQLEELEQDIATQLEE